jgi:hypothetical protein
VLRPLASAAVALRYLAAGLVSCLIAALPGATSGTHAPALFVEARVATARECHDATAVRSRCVHVNTDLLLAADATAGGAAVALNLFDDATVIAITTRVERRSPDSYTWSGSIPASRPGQATLVVIRGVVAGNVVVGRRMYQVRFVGDGVHVVREIIPHDFPDEAPPLVPPTPPGSDHGRPADRVERRAQRAGAPRRLLSPPRSGPSGSGSAHDVIPVAWRSSEELRAAAAGTNDSASDAATVRRRRAHVDFEALLRRGPSSTSPDVRAEPAEASSVQLDLFDDVSLIAHKSRVVHRPGARYTWFGHIPGIANSSVVLVVQDGVLVGNVMAGSRMYQVRFVGVGMHEVREIDTSRLPSEAPARRLDPLFEKTYVPAAAVTAADHDSTIDVLVVYTPAARAAAGGATAIEAEIQLAVDETNQSYENSGITQRIALAGTSEVAYTESGDFCEYSDSDLDRLTEPVDGYLDGVHALRNTHAADLVVLIVESGNACGCAWLMGTVSPDFESHAFSVVLRSCATGYYSFGHELGHNMGANHDWYVNTSTAPYAHAHGHVSIPGQWRTIMAYNTACEAAGVNCTRLQHWSNPEVLHGGIAMGVPPGSPSPADNRAVLNNTVFTVANFRQSPGPVLSVTPASLSFGAVPVNGTAELEFTVQNTGGGTLTGSATVAAPFAVTVGGAFSLAANATLNVTVRFSPMTSGISDGTVSFTSNGGALSLPVTGLGSAQGSTSIHVVSSRNPAVFGQTVTLTASVNASGSGNPTGTVTFRDGGTVLGVTTLNPSRQAALTTNVLAPGPHGITAEYAGDARFNGSTSSVLVQVVNKATTTTTLFSSKNPAEIGEAVTLRATVNVTAPGAGMPTGVVTFFDGVVWLGTAPLDVSRQATLTTGSSAGTGIGSASYDVALRAPKCSTPNAGCDSGTLLFSRDSIPGTGELNAPNTINDSCADGTAGSFHVDESVDRIRISTVDGTTLTPGTTVKIDVDVWAFGAGDYLDLYFTNEAANPVWTFIATFPVSGAGAATFTGTYTLPPGVLQAVRANFRYGGSASTCSAGVWDDHDDLVFAVGGSALSAGSHSVTALYAGDSRFSSSTSPVLTQVVGTPSYPLSVSVKGAANGTVSSNPVGLNCSGSCSALFPSHTAVVLTATPAPGARFKEWGGACAGTAATCTVTAATSKAVSATFSPLFTDDTLWSRETAIKVAHIAELRAAAKVLRARHGLPAVSYADPVLIARVTPFRRLHLLELRTAVNEVYQASGRPLPVYTDPTLLNGHTVVRAIHVSELRAAVCALE